MVNIKIIKVIKKVLKEYLNIIAIAYMLLNFLLWHTKVPYFETNQYKLFNNVTILLLSAFLINLDDFNVRDFVKENLMFLLIMFLSIYNSFDLIMDFKGIEVDMGERSGILILRTFPHMLLVVASFKNIDKRAFVVGVLLTLVILTTYSILPILFKHKGLESFKDVDISFTNRAESLLNNPNALGEFSFIGIYLTLFLIIISNKYFVKGLLTLLFPIFLYSLFLSKSETSLYMVGISVFILFLYFLFNNKKNKIYLSLMFIGIMFFGYLSFFKYYELIIEPLRTDMLLSGRETIWVNILKITKDYGKTGVGYNNFTYVYKEMFRKTTSPHNMLLGIYSELGLFNLVFTILWFGYLIIRNQNNIVRNKVHINNKYLIMFNVFYVTYFIGQMTEYAFLKVQTINILFLMLNGFNLKILKEYNNKKKSYVDAYSILGIILLAYITSYQKYNDLLLLIEVSIIYSFSYYLLKPIISNIIKDHDKYVLNKNKLVNDNLYID